MRSREHVCPECIEDPVLQDVVKSHAISVRCDYCGRRAKKPIACELSSVIERIRWAIEQEYNDPNEELPWDEGQYCGTVFHGAEILWEIGFSLENQQLQEDIASSFWDDAFCKRDYFAASQQDTFGFAWQRFRTVVLHQRRYTFWNVHDRGEFQDPSYGITAGTLLNILGAHIDFLSPIDVIAPGTTMWRVREFGKSSRKVNDPKQYTSPPIDDALQANRLSPPGISMFYGANDLTTAFRETIENPGKTTGRIIRAAQFVTEIPLTLLDLTDIPRPDNYFSSKWDRERRDASEFFQAFADTLSQPIARDRRYHLEYVPTQVFTEYIRFELKTGCAKQFHGIKYKSSRKTGGICYAIFADQDACMPARTGQKTKQLLRFVKGSIQKVPFKTK